MEVSTILIAVLVATFIATGLAAVILRLTRPNLLKQLDPSQGSLDVVTPIGSPGDVRKGFITPASSTLMVYIFCKSPSKTAVLGSTPDPMTLVRIGSIFQFQILPGSTSQPPKTQMAIRTQSEQSQVETIPVADFPVQQWVLLTIVKEGRRYTVYYNDTIVANSRTQYYPVVNSSQLAIGHPQLKGKFIGPKIVPVALRKDEILAELGNTSDTRHEPYSPFSFFDIFSPKLGCPGGIFCATTKQVPQLNSLQEWKSPYA